MRGRGHGRGNGPMRGRPRRITRFVEPAILLLLSQQPAHGYGLMDGLSGLGFDEYPVDYSAVYRTLRRLEERGMVISDWDMNQTSGPPRRVYRVTADGDAFLERWVSELRATDLILHRFLEAFDRHNKST